VDGKLAQIGDRWQLRFVRRLPHSPEKVWRALTEDEHLAAWFPAEIRGERAPGAALRFVHRDGAGPTLDGEMLVYEPPSALEYRWGDDSFRFDVDPDAEGCVLTFLTTFAEGGKAARDGAGWHTCFDLLAYHLAGSEPPWHSMDRWRQVHPGYVEAFGPRASTIGPPMDEQ
jgi:uncharacterized protein YndB with AHSA1/START domain